VVQIPFNKAACISVKTLAQCSPELQNDAVCDTTGVNSSNAAGYIINVILKNYHLKKYQANHLLLSL
jgi:hypothetical protein